MGLLGTDKLTMSKSTEISHALLITEIFEMLLEDGVELISPTGYVFRVGGYCRGGGDGCHIDIHWGE